MVASTAQCFGNVSVLILRQRLGCLAVAPPPTGWVSIFLPQNGGNYPLLSGKSKFNQVMSMFPKVSIT